MMSLGLAPVGHLIPLAESSASLGVLEAEALLMLSCASLSTVLALGGAQGLN